MRLAALNAARGALLAGPTALAFSTGGYLDVPRAVAGAVAWALAAAALALVPALRPLGRPALLALTGIGGLAVWTGLSALWAPLPGDALEAAQLPLLYAGALLAAVLLLRDHRAWRWAEPALAGGTLVVVFYALSERLLPGLVELERSQRAYGRLEQPLTYWNAMGVLAAVALVVCAGLLADGSRPRPFRLAAAAAAVPLGLALHLSVSRGALLALVAGLVALVLAGRRREHAAAAALVAGGGLLAAALATPFDAVTSLSGTLPSREREGALALIGLVALAGAAALVANRGITALRPGALTFPRHSGKVAAIVVVAGFVAAVSAGQQRGGDAPLATGPDRYVTLESSRYAYWEVAGRAFADAPLAGVGPGGWAIRWRQEREFAEGARDAHSLPLQTAAELGLVGLALLGIWFAGIALAARDALRAPPATMAAGPLAGFVVWAAHAALDWDFQMPAATLPALLLAATLLAQSASAMRGASRLKIQTAKTQTAR